MEGLLKYKYYDTPEGHDVFKKVFVMSKYAALTGLVGASMDVLMFSHPKGFIRTAGRFASIIGPIVGMASAFTVTANIAQELRGKNDEVNYFLGGAVAGAVFGAWQRSITAGVPAAVFLGAIAIVKKTAIDEGWVLVPDTTLATNSIISVRRDFTLAEDVDRLKTWTTGSSSN